MREHSSTSPTDAGDVQDSRVVLRCPPLSSVVLRCPPLSSVVLQGHQLHPSRPPRTTVERARAEAPLCLLFPCIDIDSRPVVEPHPGPLHTLPSLSRDGLPVLRRVQPPFDDRSPRGSQWTLRRGYDDFWNYGPGQRGRKTKCAPEEPAGTAAGQGSSCI
jgi:hypothetical protein